MTFQTYAINHADTLWRIGRLDEAYSLLSRAAELIDLVPALAPFASVGLAHVCQELGRDEESAMWAGRLDSMMSFVGESPYLRLWLLLLAARSQLRSGRVGEAVEASERAGDLAESSGILEPCVVPWHATAVEALVAAGRLDRAGEVVARLDELCAPLPCQAPRAVATAGRATLAWRLGRIDEAESLYEQALSLNRNVPMPLAMAETLVLKGRFLRHAGRMGEARKVLRQALETLEPTSCARVGRTAMEELAAAGGRQRQRRGGGALTAQEGRVASLAAQGLTNRQIAQRLYLSSKTVDHHLSRAYAKLRISSRRDLMLRWRDVKDPPDVSGLADPGAPRPDAPVA